jgi:hypothetical protein
MIMPLVLYPGVTMESLVKNQVKQQAVDIHATTPVFVVVW